ncbi:MAG: peptide chain release factor N(5)-glutamine methyltransferase [Verrucomicrobia bacterium]|nr:peptide chain release factor N(5)-glutamine methyltransferase [Verrucomicrobiota bacterium]
MTVLETIQRSAEFLAKKGVDSPRLQVESLLAHVLRLPRLNLYLNFERELTSAELEIVRGFVKRRGAREPLQHIVGSTSFCGFEIAVDPNVLIPRPETELLAERAWSFLNFLSTGRNQPTEPLAALDFGTGSGCLAVALALKCACARIVALDISFAALAVARANAKRLHATVEFLESDGFDALPSGELFDLIVANPPYIPSAEIAVLDPEVCKFDPRLALDGGADGLDFYRRLAREAAGFLKPTGRLMLELGDEQAASASDLLDAHNWVVEAVERDYAGRERILVAAPGAA